MFEITFSDPKQLLVHFLIIVRWRIIHEVGITLEYFYGASFYVSMIYLNNISVEQYISVKQRSMAHTADIDLSFKC